MRNGTASEKDSKRRSTTRKIFDPQRRDGNPGQREREQQHAGRSLYSESYWEVIPPALTRELAKQIAGCPLSIWLTRTISMPLK